MSAGCVHKQGSVLLAAGFMVGGLVFGDLPSALGTAMGALVGIIISPDQDVDNGNISNTIIKKQIGSWAERGWSLLWYFYSGSIKHGSPLSHFPVISTIGRLAYLYFFLLALPYAILGMVVPGAWTMGDELAWWNNAILSQHGFILGLMGSDLIHYCLDLLTTEHAKQKKKEIFGMPLASSQCK